MYAGVDEAGRGPVLGPLVVAGVGGDPEQIPDGVADSKQLTPARREELAARLHASALAIAVRSVTAEELNGRMQAGETLDEIEAEAFATVLDELGPDTVVTDQVGAGDGFAAKLEDLVTTECEITAEIGADATHRIVGAASIVAKVQRDEAIAAIGDELDADVGSGYPSDPATRAFLEAWRESSIHPPPYARTAWSTLDAIGFNQARLGEPMETATVADEAGSKPPEEMSS